jgi:hypothetical protein
LHRGPLEWHYLLIKFHENLPSGSKLAGDTHRQTGDLISLLSFFNLYNFSSPTMTWLQMGTRHKNTLENQTSCRVEDASIQMLERVYILRTCFIEVSGKWAWRLRRQWVLDSQVPST